MAYKCVIVPRRDGGKSDRQWFKGENRINESDLPANVLKNQECKQQRFIAAGPGAKLPPKSKTPKGDGSEKLYTCYIEKRKKIYGYNGKFIDEYDIPSGIRRLIKCDPDLAATKRDTIIKKSAQKSAKKNPKKSVAKKSVAKKSVVARKRQLKREESFAQLNEPKPKSKSKKSNLNRASPRARTKSKTSQKPQPQKAPEVITTAMVLRRKKGAATKKVVPSEAVDA